jgi:hypothetical protein
VIRVLLLLLAAAVAAPAPTPDDVYLLQGGDRVSGKTVLKGKTSHVLQTPYGRLTIPRAKIERILWADGHEEIVSAPAAPARPAEPPLKLTLVVTGSAFWQAWPKNLAVDPTLRLAATLDEEAVVTYSDSHLDPQDLPGATVNTFSFDPKVLSVQAAEGILAQPPETRPGRSLLKLALPLKRSGKRQLRIAYQANDGSAEAPAWHDKVEASLAIDLEPSTPTIVEIQQDRGQMEFSGLLHKKMKNVDSFKIEARLTTSAGSDSP